MVQDGRLRHKRDCGVPFFVPVLGCCCVLSYAFTRLPVCLFCAVQCKSVFDRVGAEGWQPLQLHRCAATVEVMYEARQPENNRASQPGESTFFAPSAASPSLFAIVQSHAALPSLCVLCCVRLVVPMAVSAAVAAAPSATAPAAEPAALAPVALVAAAATSLDVYTDADLLAEQLRRQAARGLATLGSLSLSELSELYHA